MTSWAERARIYRAGDFAATLVVLAVAMAISSFGLFRRDIPVITLPLNATSSLFLRDPSLNHKMRKEQVSPIVCMVLAYALPLLVHAVVQWRHRIANDTRDFVLSLLLSATLAQLFTNIIKSLAGRFRPSFYDMCDWNTEVLWDGVANLCRNAAGEAQGRKSFPSGHSSTAFSGLCFLSLYLVGRARVAACTHGTRSMLSAAKLFGACLPLLLATWVALTRSQDNWHHYSDIAVGALIGIASAFVAHAFNYVAVCSPHNAGLPLETCVADPAGTLEEPLHKENDASEC
ncbi:hypothetical protein SDRG_06894 [Saprolegnia diclina VS20]|uniref:Phosphatidic acid phosphatase type 2/haloperoxidase domain-containing protein n=1 Tax=Saprolegnia diclina (strain VS20) TaxID=1156394 RepID=T0QCJ5_SAPDV|nr:hypothetical protein SDRG_06894 [Saprolegnia diclina VS20]EQC35609.1 hypothetical protein SDRG_06894 [Saprolegnia diclina VS20]|eukprot:XP_008610926.1 hypothetical protein SDRG_06894 [Saprolegnia diclina VS20]